MVAESHTVEPGHAVADELAADPIVRREPLVRQDPCISDPPARRDWQVRRAPNSAGLYDVLDLILDKGIVIDAFVRVSLVGIELLTVDLRVVIASVDTYLRYAEGVEKLGVYNRDRESKLSDLAQGGMKGKALEKGAEKVGEAFSGHGGDDQDEGGDGSENQEGVVGTLAHGVRKVLGHGVRRFVGRLAGEEGEDEGQGHGDDPGSREPEQARSGGRGESQRHGRSRPGAGSRGAGGGQQRSRPHGSRNGRSASSKR